ncbi:hypothetical protein OKW76_08115 [Sphingomonas sp. S1-29]|uniref:hypothetical protein n=1 Tax=Sphingomonas sp. S1-29 TaxID=2991074 RepID=UPI00224018A6|nr:hypothetical protein [Sphingomonas sp. S1-29]UZK68050.1 hypothetical protein OKW76_08115 [Sphingomonas sp. S1-29]
MNDVCLGISQDQLNQILASVYDKTHAQLFKGNASLDFQGTTVNLTYDIGAPPLVNLSAGLHLESAAQAVLTAAASHPEFANANAEFVPQDHVETVAALLVDAPGLTITLNPIVITFSSGPESAPMTVSSVTQATLTSSGGKIGFNVISTAVTSGGTPFQQWLTTKFIQPKMNQIIQQALGGVSFAIPSIPGVPVSPFSVGIVGGNLLAVANVNGGQPPVPTQPVPGLGQPFFVSLDNAALQAAAQAAIGNGVALNGGDSSGGSGFSVHYNYSFRAVNPQVQAQGNQIAATFSVAGSAGAGAEVFWVDIGIGVDVGTSPNPTLIANVVPRGNSVSIVSDHAQDFNIDVNLSGSVGKLVGWMVNWLLSSIANALKPQILGYLGGINFATLDIPAITQPIGDTSITITPWLTNTTGGGGGVIILGGNLAAS